MRGKRICKRFGSKFVQFSFTISLMNGLQPTSHFQNVKENALITSTAGCPRFFENVERTSHSSPVQ